MSSTAVRPLSPVGLPQADESAHAPRPSSGELAAAARVTLSSHARVVLDLQQIASSHQESADGLLRDLAGKMRAQAAKEPKNGFLGRVAAEVERAANTGDYSRIGSVADEAAAPAGSREAPSGGGGAFAVAAYTRTMAAAR